MIRGAAVGLLPSQTRTLTDYELEIVEEGARLRRRDEAELLAWVQAGIVSPHVKRKVKPRDFIAPAKPSEFQKELSDGDDAAPRIDGMFTNRYDELAAISRAEDARKEAREVEVYESHGEGKQIREMVDDVTMPCGHGPEFFDSLSAVCMLCEPDEESDAHG